MVFDVAFVVRGKLHHAANDGVRPAGGVVHLVEDHLHICAGVAKGVLQKVHAEDDRLQRVLHLMSDAAGKSADRFELLGLDQLHLRGL